MKRPTNSTEWEILYNFNYFCLLVTGVFDSLAWLTVHRYSISINNPLQVSIQITGTRSQGAEFVHTISKSNASLASFIQNQQDFIKLFYPMRHSAQHREPIAGSQFIDENEGWTASMAKIEEDALVAIQKIDNKGHPFSEWGLLDTAKALFESYGFALFEPYRFTRQALRKLISFSNEYLEILNFPSIVSQELNDKIVNAKSKDQEFIDLCLAANIYWRRNSHLPILFRNKE